MRVQKVLNGRDWRDDDTFTFTLSASGAAPMPANKEISITRADADHTKGFGEIKFDKAGTYEYTVKETKGSLAGITYDETEHKVTIKVVDDGKGNLVAAADSGLIQTVTITNEYKADGTAAFTAHKNLENGTLTENQFTFELLDSKGDVVQTKGNAADGNVTFDAIKFETAGTYDYTIREQIPADAVKNESGNWVLGDYVYDGHTVAVTVKVTDRGSGKFETETTYEGGTATFTNTHVVTDMKKVTPDGTDLSGATLQVLDSTGKVIYEWISDGSLKRLNGLKDGEYTLHEAASPAGYDLAADITFTMKDGKLQGFDGGVITMTDARTTGGGSGGPRGGGGRKPRPDTPTNYREDVPDVLGATRDLGEKVLGAIRTKPQEVLGAVRTGDTSAMLQLAGVLAAAVAALGAWIAFFFRRRRRNAQ